MSLEKLKEVQAQNVKEMIPSGWNVYEWTEKHPETTIAHSLKRMEKIMDASDNVYFAFSGGKDSTVAANLACLELNLRRLRIKAGIDRDGNDAIDPLDKKWEHKNLSSMMTDAEVVFSFTNDYTKRFLKRMGPQGHNLIEFNWFTLSLAWQSGVSFNSGYLISWEKDKENIWVQPMPTKEDLFGFEPVSENNVRTANPVLLSSLKESAQKYHRDNLNVFETEAKNLFGFGYPDYKEAFKDLKEDTIVEAVGNFGRGPLTIFELGMHEKDFSSDYSRWSFETADLVTSDEFTREELAEAFSKRHDTSRDVWSITGNENGIVSSALVSLRAEESLDRRVILRQGEYSTGQYSNSGGVNNFSIVFDYKTETIWQILSATDWDVNEVYERLFEAGVAPADQRVGSLLNYAAVRSIGTVKALEPELYSRINGRFSNVEFMASFSNKGYYNIAKPKDVEWDGKNHLRAGMSKEELVELSNKYEELLKELEIPYIRLENNVDFESADPKFKNKPWYPFKNWMKENKDQIEKLEV